MHSIFPSFLIFPLTCGRLPAPTCGRRCGFTARPATVQPPPRVPDIPSPARFMGHRCARPEGASSMWWCRPSSSVCRLRTCRPSSARLRLGGSGGLPVSLKFPGITAFIVLVSYCSFFIRLLILLNISFTIEENLVWYRDVTSAAHEWVAGSWAS